MTTVSTLLSLGFIPLNLLIYGTAYLPQGRNAASIVPFSAIVLSFVIMLFPMTCGIIINRRWPHITAKIVTVIILVVVLIKLLIATIYKTFVLAKAITEQ